MEAALNILQQYRMFLQTIPLDEYREQFRLIKWVEQDLPREVLPQGSIFRHYWDEQNFLDFESWFEDFWEELHSDALSLSALRQFKKYYFDKNDDGWFKQGFKARMYRTWTAVLTQLDYCYMFVYVAARERTGLSLESNEELDLRGVDARVGNIDFQVKKISERKEARPGTVRRNKITIPYAVFNIPEYIRLSNSTRVRPENRIKYRRAAEAHGRYFQILENGFIVFSEYYVSEIIRNIDNIRDVKARIDAMLLELSGESA